MVPPDVVFNSLSDQPPNVSIAGEKQSCAEITGLHDRRSHSTTHVWIWVVGACVTTLDTLGGRLLEQLNNYVIAISRQRSLFLSNDYK